MIEVTDAIDRQVRLGRPPSRIVSLVPSETASVVDLVGPERLVGRTDYCVEPAGLVEAVSTVGGTKGFDIDAVKALEPDLVLANKEENSRPLVQALIAAGLTVHVSFPCTVAESLAYLRTLCLMLGRDPGAAEPFRFCNEAVARLRLTSSESKLPVFVPIWKDPWMTFDGGVYASDVLDLCGASNVFHDRSRAYPLAADLGNGPPRESERIEERDTRYPRIRLEEVIERGARVVFLPDEPYAFGPSDASTFSELNAQPPIRVELVDGKDLFWYGTRLAGAVERLRAQIGRLRSELFGLQANN